MPIHYIQDNLGENPEIPYVPRRYEDLQGELENVEKCKFTPWVKSFISREQKSLF